MAAQSQPRPRTINLETLLIGWAEGCLKNTKDGVFKGVNLEKTDKHVNFKKIKNFTVEFDHANEKIVQKVGESPTRTDEGLKLVYESTFENNTELTQNHTFTATRETTSTFNVSITKGNTTVVNGGVTIKIPKGPEGTIGFSKSVSVTESENTLQGEKVSWFVDTAIWVPKHSRATAIAYIKEVTYVTTFVAKVEISGVVDIIFTDQKSGVEYPFSQDITKIFQQMVVERSSDDRLLYPKLAEAITIDPVRKCTTWTIEGSTNLTYGLKQHVVLRQEPLGGGTGDAVVKGAPGDAAVKGAPGDAVVKGASGDADAPSGD